MRARFRQVPIKIMRLARSIDRKTVELGEPSDLPAAVLLCWPTKPTVTTLAVYSRVAAAPMQILASASTQLASIKVWKRLCTADGAHWLITLITMGALCAFVVLAIWPLRVTPRRGIEQ
jgi:hypothetical protein